MKATPRIWLTAASAGITAVIGLTSAGMAAPVPGPASLAAATAMIDPQVQVRSERKGRRSQARRARMPANHATPYGEGRDTVGSLGTDRQGRTINRFTGQVYYTCMLDEGYGRVRPCDAGGGGGGGGSFN